jgi:hypothetical protein
MSDRTALAGLNAIGALLVTLLPEREPNPEVYDRTVALADALAAGEWDWPAQYAQWEVELLAALGFGLDLTRCGASGVTEDLVFVSPRTGRAVSHDSGGAWADRLLPLPGFLIGRGAPSIGAVRESLRMSGYFLENWVCPALERKALPEGRFESRDIETRSPDRLQDHAFSQEDRVDGCRQQWRYLQGDHDSTVFVGVNQAAVLDDHAEDVHLATNISDMDIGVAWAETPSQQLKSISALIQVPNGAIGYGAQRAEALVQRGMDLSPPGSYAGLRVDVLDHNDRRSRALRRVLVVLQRLTPLFFGAEADHRSDHRRARIPNHRRQDRVSSYERLTGIARRARSFGCRDFQRVTDRRRVESGQRC